MMTNALRIVDQIETLKQENEERGEFLKLRVNQLRAIMRCFALRACESDLNGRTSTHERKRFRSDPEAKKQVFERTGKRSA